MEGDNVDGAHSCIIREYTIFPAYTDGSDPAKTPTQDASCEGKQQSADVLPLSGGANCYDNNIAGGVSWD